MTPPLAKPLYMLVPCSQCQALADATAGRCWLCGGAVELAAEPIELKPPTIHRVAGRIVDLSMLMIAMALVAVVFGTYRESAGLSLVLLAAITPPLVSVAIASTKHRARGETMSWWHKLGTFVLVSTLTVGVAAFAGFVALLTVCLAVPFGQSGERTVLAVVIPVVLGGLALAVYIGVLVGTHRRN